MRLENCHHRPLERVLAAVGPNPSRHGWHGWLQVGERDSHRPRCVISGWCRCCSIRRTRRSTISGSRSNGCIDLVEAKADPNDWRLVTENAVGVRYTPLTTRNHARMGARERVLETAQKYPDRLRIELDALVTRVLLDEQQPRDRRRIPEGRAALPRPWPARRPRRRAPSGAGDARGHPLRRRLQYAAAPDAVGDRAPRRIWSRSAFRCGSSCPGSARTCRTATRSASSTA